MQNDAGRSHLRVSPMRFQTPIVYLSAALFLSIPGFWDVQRERYLSLKNSHTAMLNEEARLTQRRYDLAHEISELQAKLYQKQRHYDAVSARLSSLQISIKELEKQM
jgi:uncharacterized protein YlxW (UPF0749 family)